MRSRLLPGDFCQRLLTRHGMPKSLFTTVMALAVVAPLPARAGEAPISLQGHSAYYGLPVPQQVQALTLHADLSDVQVLNARGEPMPFAWAAPWAEVGTPKQQSVPFFKTPKPARPAPVASAPSVAWAGQDGDWILDTRGVPGALQELALSLAKDASGVYAFSVDASTDLQQWRPVQAAAQLILLEHQGLRLDSSRFQLDGLHAAYLRLRPLAGSPMPPLRDASVTSVPGQVALPPMQWSAPLKPVSCTAQYCDYPVPRHFPLERIAWQLTSGNTLAQVQVLGQPDLTEQTDAERAGHRHGLRRVFKALRRKTAPDGSASSTSEPHWARVMDTTLYWLQLPQGEVRSPASVLPGHLYLKLRLQPTGGMASLGPQAPELRVGAREPALVFLARGPAPYRIAWAGAEPTAALSMAALMPTRKTGDAVPAHTAKVEWPAPGANAPRPVVETQPQANPLQKFWLWGVLAVALALMAAMAWSLLKPKPQ
ncbi:MAG: hypothetical protein JWP29_56 [Rhodoferax sp.]|nr:hypothetical protein [Rhodoferax sp.]